MIRGIVLWEMLLTNLHQTGQVHYYYLIIKVLQVLYNACNAHEAMYFGHLIKYNFVSTIICLNWEEQIAIFVPVFGINRKCKR